jgi:hypothetical protein
MTYPTIEQSESTAKQTYLFFFTLPDSILTYTNAPSVINAAVNGADYAFIHPRGGISFNDDNSTTESPDAGRTGCEIKVSRFNPIIRKHRAFPPPGNSEVTIFRQNEIDGDIYQVWSGIIVETPINENQSEEFGVIRCQHIAEMVSGSEGLVEDFGPSCDYMHTVFPCPVPIAAATDSNLTVEDIDTENFTVTLSGSIHIAGKYKSGVLNATNGDRRLVLDDVLDGSDHVLTITQNFPAATLRVGDVVSVIRGCDRLPQTCRDEWGAFTGNGAAHSANNLQANKNPHQIGRLQ